MALYGTSAADVEIRSAERLTHVTVNGEVNDVKVGREGATKRLAPSYLEFYMNARRWLYTGARLLLVGGSYGVFARRYFGD